MGWARRGSCANGRLIHTESSTDKPMPCVERSERHGAAAANSFNTTMAVSGTRAWFVVLSSTACTTFSERADVSGVLAERQPSGQGLACRSPWRPRYVVELCCGLPNVFRRGCPMLDCRTPPRQTLDGDRHHGASDGQHVFDFVWQELPVTVADASERTVFDWRACSPTRRCSNSSID